MNKRQLVLLFLGNLVPWTIGNGIVPLMPVYALELHASEAISGYYLAFAFTALAAGTILGGLLADLLQRRKLLLILSGILMVPALWLMGEAGNVWQLAGATVLLMFLLGMTFSVITILAGLFAPEGKRGKVLGLLAVTNGLGSIIGGLSIGYLVDRWGYRTMFLALCLFSTILLMTSLIVKDKKTDRAPKHAEPARAGKLNFGKAFVILLIAQLVVVTINSMGSMARSLSMNNLEFTATAISSTLVISGIVSLPLPFIIGSLSDKIGRKPMMIICYASYGLCMVLLAFSTSLWHFWVAIIFLKIGMVSMNVGAAFVADLVDQKALGRGMSLFQTMGFFALAVGCAVAGSAFQGFGIANASFMSTALPVIGIVLVISIRVVKQKEAIA